jgi:hypothetical protein
MVLSQSRQVHPVQDLLMGQDIGPLHISTSRMPVGAPVRRATTDILWVDEEIGEPSVHSLPPLGSPSFRDLSLACNVGLSKRTTERKKNITSIAK